MKHKERNETGAFDKPWKNRVKVALVYPNDYSVGMSSLGFQTIYRLLNEKPHITCERFFLPDRSGEAPKSVESGHGLSDFDFIFFSVSYSDDFLNIYKILSSAKVILPREKRFRNRGPVLIAGGTAVTINPEPLAPVFDLLFLGEGESFIERFSSLTGDSPGIVGERDAFLDAMRPFAGVYIPEDLDVEYGDGRSVKRFIKKHKESDIRRSFEEEVNSFSTYSSLFTPDSRFGRIFMEEISRGCARGCRFCAIGYIGRPFRTRRMENLRFEVARSGFKVGILGAAISDHPQIKEIAKRVLRVDDGLSFSSFRVDKVDDGIAAMIREAGVRSFTIAPEAGSERLRRIIGKEVSDDEILDVASRLKEAGVSVLKFYFMIGLPFETEADIDAIIRTLSKAALVFKGGRIDVTLSPFIPKPFTPFQWRGMASPECLKRTYSKIKAGVAKGAIRIESLDIKEAIVDAFFSNADRRHGLQLLGWISEGLDPKKKILEASKNPRCFIYSETDTRLTLPWDFIGDMPDKKSLIEEYSEAQLLSQ